MAFFKGPKQIVLKFIWNSKRPQIFKAILKENEAGGITLPDVRVDYKAILIKTA